MGKKCKIAVLTSGGDSPGMNAAIRSITRVGISHGLSVYGVKEGYLGLYEGDFSLLSTKDVGGVLASGGTFLGTSRFPELLDEKVQKEMSDRIKKYGFDCVFVIGGNGSLKGAYEVSRFGASFVVLPGSIDNDIPGTEISIGVDTALNTIIYAVDRIKDTASSHQRTFIIEVMGRNSGYLALIGAIATGADCILIPEFAYDIDKIAEEIEKRRKAGKRNTIILTSEGVMSASQLSEKLKDIISSDIRLTILGHIQRGGSPTAFDRVLASRMGRIAVENYIAGNKNFLTGFSGINIVTVSLDRVVNMVKPSPVDDVKTVKYLAI